LNRNVSVQAASPEPAQIKRTDLIFIESLENADKIHTMQYEFKNKKITVMGLGLFGGGGGVAQFLAKQGARVTVTDLRNASELLPSLKQLEGLPISHKLGGHDEEDFINVDMVIVNPAVPKDSKYLQIARNNHVPVNTEINIFFQWCPAPIIGITGSNGKSTTTTLTGKILQETPRRAWVGGNIGKSLLSDLEEIKPSDIVVLELSSFQLEGLDDAQKSPHISILTNISPNHLDRYSDMKEYIHAKKGIINSIQFSSIGATFLTFAGFLLGYLSEKVRFKLKNSTSAFIWIFFAVPATVIGIGLIKLYNRPGMFFQNVYGSLWIIIIGYMARFLPLSTRIQANYLKQIPYSLEEAGSITGASWFQVLGKIVFPLQFNGIITTWLICFIFCIGELGTTILVYPPGHETLPITLFTIMANSPEDIVSALSIIIVFMTLLPLGIFLSISRYITRISISVTS